MSTVHTSHNDLHMQIDSLIDQATLMQEKESEQVINSCKRTRRLLKKTDYPHGTIRNGLLHACALEHAARFQEAHEVLLELEPICRTHGTEHDLAELQFLLGQVSNILHDYGKGLLSLEESLQLYEKLNHPEGRTKVYLTLSISYLGMNISDTALEYAFKGLELFQKAENSGGISKTLNNIGMIYYDLRDYDRSVEFYQESLTIKRELGDSMGVANTLYNIANIFLWAHNDYEKALDYYTQARIISKEHGHSNILALALQLLGQVYAHVGEYETAIQYALDGIEIVQDLGTQSELIIPFMDLGFIYFNAGDTKKSLEYIFQGLAIAQELQLSSHILRGYNLLRQIYCETKNFEEATTFSTLYIELQRELSNDASERRAKQLAVLFEVEKAKQEKERYRLQTEKMQQEMEHKSRELTAMAMYLMQKNEFLSKLSRQIEETPPVKENAANKLLESLLGQIREAIRGEKGWEHFEQQFKLVHHDFIGQLSERFPTLTPIEMKVGALLRMNLSTKEIANLLYQSPRSIESYRYRLRRKMEIPATLNLVTFLSSI